MGKGANRNKLCPCGSGEKYKNCHLKREDESPLPPVALVGKMSQAWGTRVCMHPGAAPGVCDRVIEAHTVGRSLALKQVVDETNHVLSFMVPTMGKDGLPLPGRIGWKRASTITGFCGKHDAETFRAVEDEPFSASAEQCFLLAYRAVCYELFQKGGALKSAPVVKRHIDRGRKPSEQAEIQSFLSMLGVATAAGDRDMREIKEAMEKALIGATWDTIHSLVVRVDGVVDVVTSGGASPSETMEGEKVQELADLQVRLQALYLNVIPDPDGSGGWYVFSWRKGSPAIEKVVASLERVSRSSLADVLVHLQFVLYENTFLRRQWWANLGDPARDLLRRAMFITDGAVSKAVSVEAGLARFKVRNTTRVPDAV
jgi:SEC-C motif